MRMNEYSGKKLGTEVHRVGFTVYFLLRHLIGLTVDILLNVSLPQKQSNSVPF